MEFVESTITKEVQKQFKPFFSDDLLRDLEKQELFGPFFRQKRNVEVHGEQHFTSHGLIFGNGKGNYRIEWQSNCPRPLGKGEFVHIIFDRNPDKYRSFVRVLEASDSHITISQADRRMTARVEVDLKCSIMAIPEDYFQKFYRSSKIIVRRVNKKFCSQTKDKFLSQDYILNGEVREEPNLIIPGSSASGTLLNVSYGGCLVRIPNKFEESIGKSKMVYVPIRLRLDKIPRIIGAFAFPRNTKTTQEGCFLNCSFVVPLPRGAFL